MTTEHRTSAEHRPAALRVHAIETGRIVANATALRARGWSALLRRRRNVEFPAYVYIVEHPEGNIAIDTGMSAGGWPVPLPARRLVPSALTDSVREIGPGMEELGLDPKDVRTVVVTHLDVDHVGGVGHFPDAEVLVHRPEHDFAARLPGKLRYQPKLWHPRFDPTVYDLDDQPYGPFPKSRALTRSGDVRLVPIAGHSIGQVGVVVEHPGRPTLFFVADHVLSQDWLVEDIRVGRLHGLGGLAFPQRAVKTTERIRRFAAERPVVLVPAHDEKAPSRLAAMEPLELPPSPG